MTKGSGILNKNLPGFKYQLSTTHSAVTLNRLLRDSKDSASLSIQKMITPKYQDSQGAAPHEQRINHRGTTEHGKHGKGPGNTRGRHDQGKNIAAKGSQEQREQSFS